MRRSLLNLNVGINSVEIVYTTATDRGLEPTFVL